ncbi:general secretion pathway protein GspB [Psychromonas sp. MME2]|uniref:general secretion pathway protein GspB n=1 Tax=unclassified Psychromonas TaxID=2614957 RepID=UPI00339C80AD
MSTISRALQKSRAHQLPYGTELYNKDNRHTKLKRALVVSLLVVLCLLITVLFLLIKPRDARVDAIQISPEIVIEKTESQPEVAKSVPPKDRNRVEKITFSVKPLPVIKKEPEVKVVTAPLLPAVTAPVAAAEKGSDLLADDTTQEIDYGDTPSDLQKRFQTALLMVDELGKVESSNTPPINNDGRDIHQMDSELQRKIPPLQYDSHMYSSKQQDRWVRINGEDLKEGQFSHSTNIEVVEIQPNRTIFRFGPRSFSLESLENWDGF